MEKIDKTLFFDIINNFAIVPFTQSRGYIEMSDGGNQNRYMFFVDSLEKPSIACAGYIMKRFGLKLLIIDGECLCDEKNIDSKKIRDFYKEIAQAGFDMVEVSSSLPYNALYEIGIRQAGFLKPVGLFSTPLTIVVDLQHEISYNKQRTVNLKNTEKFSLALEYVQNPTDEHINRYVVIHKEMSDRKQFIDTVNFDRIKILLSDTNFYLFFVKKGKNYVAGNIVYARNNAAIGVYSCTSFEGREVYAGFFMKDKIYSLFKEQGYFTFDYGRISPAAHKKNNLFIAKNGVKGDYLLYCGEWSWYKRQIYRPLMYFVKKYLFKRVEV